MTLKRVLPVLMLLWGFVFVFQGSKLAFGSKDSVQPTEASKYDNLLALDKKAYKELVKLEAQLNKQNKSLEELKNKIKFQRRSK